MHVAFGVFLLGYFCVLLGCFFKYAAKSHYYKLILKFKVDRTLTEIT